MCGVSLIIDQKIWRLTRDQTPDIIVWDQAGQASDGKIEWWREGEREMVR